jgi:hypothetical protein
VQGTSRSHLFVTNCTRYRSTRTVEIEREGANLFMTILTLGLWFIFFQSASIEIYEVRSCSLVDQSLPTAARLRAHRTRNTVCIIMQLHRIQTLYLKDNEIVGEIQPRERCGRAKFVIDCPLDGDKSTKDLFFELKEAWNVARHSILQDPFNNAVDDQDDDDLLIRN